MLGALDLISLEAAKEHLSVEQDDTDDDDLIEGLIADAVEFVESKAELVILPRKITETVPMLRQYVDLSSWPVQDVLAIRYPVANALQLLPATNWAFSLTRRPVRIIPTFLGWGAGLTYLSSCLSLATLPCEIDVSAGYTDVTQVPRRVLRAMLLLIDHWYRNRSAAEVGSRAAGVAVPFAVDDLLDKLRSRTI